jgi:hypothetical protein
MIGMSRLGDLSKLKLQPKKKEQVYDELNELRIQLGLSRTNGDMSMTRKIVKRVGSLTDVLSDIRENEKQ